MIPFIDRKKTIHYVELEKGKFEKALENVHTFSTEQCKSMNRKSIKFALKVINHNLKQDVRDSEKKKLERLKNQLEGVLPVIENDENHENQLKYTTSALDMVITITNSFLKVNKK